MTNYFKKYFRKKEPSLVEIIEKKKETNKDLEKILQFNIKNLWLSRFEIIGVVIISLFFLFLSHFQSFVFSKKLVICIEKLWPFDGNFIILSSSSNYQNLIAIHFGIGAVLIGLAFFIAQELTKGESYKGLVLLRRSHFFSLLVAEILFSFQFLWGSLNFLSIISIFSLGVVTIYSLYESIKLIANGFSLKKHEEEIFYKSVRSKFLQTFHFQAIQIIGNKKLSEKIKEVEEFKDFMSCSIPMNQGDYIKIKSSKSGRVTDIKIDKLKKLRSILQNSNNSEPCIFIYLRFYSVVEKNKTVLLLIKKDVLPKNHDQKMLQRMFQKIFEIKDYDFDYAEARNKTLKVKARCIELINNQNVEDLNKTMTLYLTVIKDFYEYLELYANENSKMEISNYNATNWINKDIKDIVDFVLSTKNVCMIKAIIYAPKELMQCALEKKDLLFFQHVVHYPIIFYKRGHEALINGDQELGKCLLDNSLKYLTEFCVNQLKWKFEDESSSDKVFNGFMRSVFNIFQILIKISFDKRDLESFKLFVKKTKKLFDHLILGKSQNSEIYKDLREINQKMFFGLSSWILFKLEDDKSLQKFFDEIIQNIPKTIVDLTNVLSIVCDYDSMIYETWLNWEREGVCDGEVYKSTLHEKLEKLYVVQSLKSFQSKKAQGIKEIKSLSPDTLTFLAKKVESLLKILNDIESKSKNWEFVLNEDEISKINAFKKILEQVKQSQQDLELESKRNTIVSEEKIKSSPIHFASRQSIIQSRFFQFL